MNPEKGVLKRENFNNQTIFIDRRPLDDAPCPTSKLHALWFQSRKSLQYSLYKSVYQVNPGVRQIQTVEA